MDSNSKWEGMDFIMVKSGKEKLRSFSLEINLGTIGET